MNMKLMGVLILMAMFSVWPLYSPIIKEFFDVLLFRKEISRLKKIKEEILIEVLKNKLLEHNERLEKMKSWELESERSLLIKTKNFPSNVIKPSIKEVVSDYYKKKLSTETISNKEVFLKNIFLID